MNAFSCRKKTDQKDQKDQKDLIDQIDETDTYVEKCCWGAVISMVGVMVMCLSACSLVTVVGACLFGVPIVVGISACCLKKTRDCWRSWPSGGTGQGKQCALGLESFNGVP